MRSIFAEGKRSCFNIKKGEKRSKSPNYILDLSLFPLHHKFFAIKQNISSSGKQQICYDCMRDHLFIFGTREAGSAENLTGPINLILQDKKRKSNEQMIPPNCKEIFPICKKDVTNLSVNTQFNMLQT